MGLRLVTAPFALFGFGSGTRIPARIIADKLSPRATAELITLATALASLSGLYLSINSLGMLSFVLLCWCCVATLPGYLVLYGW